MFNQHRMVRIFKAITLLKTAPPKSVKLLAKQLETTERTVYRYADMLKSLGFNVQKNATNHWYIQDTDASLLPTFTIEETQFLKQLILQYGNANVLKDSVLHKLQNLSEIEDIGLQLVNIHTGAIIAKLQEAIAQQKQVMLTKYHSVHSNSISDRLVEPFQFADDYQYICAFEISSQQNKFFAINRITDLHLDATNFQFSSKHYFETVDVFGFSSNGNNFEVTALLTLRACILLKEEYPATIPFITKDSNSEMYILALRLNNPKPFLRFANGLPNEVSITGNTALLQYIANNQNNNHK